MTSKGARLFRLAMALALAVLAQFAARAEGLVSAKRLSASLAAELVMAAVTACAQKNYHVGAVVVDTSGVQQAALRGDGAALSRLVRNLLENAVRHARSRVEVTVRTHGGYAVVTVADDGPGIPERDRMRVFDRFVRLGSDRARSSGGTGLGLAIVAEIVTAHGGEVTIGDRLGGGTVVTVQLQLTRLPDSNR